MPPVALAQSPLEGLDGFFGEFDLVHELTCEFLHLLPEDISEQLREAVSAYKERTAFVPTLLSTTGLLLSDVEAVKETLAYMDLSGPLRAIADWLEVPESIYAMDLDTTTGRVGCNVLEAGLVDWHSDSGVNAHDRRLLIPLTSLPLVMHIDESGASDSVKDSIPSKRVSLPDQDGQLKAIFFDSSLPHRVVLDDAGRSDALAGQAAVMYLDIPLTNVGDPL